MLSKRHQNWTSPTLASKVISADVLAVGPPVAGSPCGPPDAGVKPGPSVNTTLTPMSSHVKVVGAPTLPSKSIARTENVCGPTSVSSRPHSKPPRFMNCASSKPHGSYGQKSTLHSKVTSGSFEWNVKMASGATPAASGWYSHSNFAGVESARPAPFRSIARTSKVWSPGERLRISAGYSQSSHAFGSVLSMRHSNTSSKIGVTSSLPMYVKLALRLFEMSAGWSTIHVSGSPG